MHQKHKTRVGSLDYVIMQERNAECFMDFEYSGKKIDCVKYRHGYSPE